MPTKPGKQIVLVSSGQPGANPRLVKEAIALFEAGYRVKVIYCFLSAWADEFDAKVFSRYAGIEWIGVGAHSVKNKWGYRKARLRQKINEWLSSRFPNNSCFAIRSLVLFNQELENETGKHPADLYIGHNLGALTAVVKAAKKHNGKCVFDFEDFHRGEFSKADIRTSRIEKIENEYVPQLDCISSSSPLIEATYKEIFPDRKWLTINNCFPRKYGAKELNKLDPKPLRLFWFSQFVGKNRGLEHVVQSMGKLKPGSVEFVLLGNCSAEMNEYLVALGRENNLQPSQLQFIGPVAEDQIVEIASTCHIGLACEVPHIFNRELCLTNKVFMYPLAGNAIAFSNTNAQLDFLKEHPEIGFSFDQNNPDQLAELLRKAQDNPQFIQQCRAASFRLGTGELNWEKEKEKLLKMVDELLS